MHQDTFMVELSRISANLHMILDQHNAEFGHFKDPVHLDLHLASSQSVIYRDLLNIIVPTIGPLIRALGAHYFAYDRTRLTKIMAPASIIRHQFSTTPLAPDSPSENDIIFLNHLVMVTYRQIFQERRTLNGWLLRMSEANLLDGNGRFELILEEPDQENPPTRNTTVRISKALASLLIPDVFIEIFKEIIIPRWGQYCRCIGATERFGVAAALFTDVDKYEEKLRAMLPGPDAVQELPEYRQGEETIRSILRLPPPSIIKSRENEIRRDLFKMLQSTVLYLRLYDSCHFVSLTTRANGFPYGLTVLSAEALPPHSIEELHAVVEQVGETQHNAVEQLLREGRRPKLPEHTSLHTTDLEFRNHKEAEALWSLLINTKRIPGHALAVFLKVLEKAASALAENRHSSLAFVLSQSSYLESVGFVALEVLHSSTQSGSYLDLADGTRDKSLTEAARFYELDRWETGRGILPYDMVRSIKPNGKANGSDLDSFLKKLNFPDPSQGFHLLDLDAHFTYPQIGINCVRRLGTGIIGRFQEGLPPGQSNGYQAYVTLSRQVNRFVAGITSSGNAALIFEGRIWAEFRDHRWYFYNHNDAHQLFMDLVKDFDSSILESALDAVQRICMSRHGGIIVLSNVSAKLWENGRGREHFLPPPEMDIALDYFDSDLDIFTRLAERDGCCIVGAQKELLGYGCMINVRDKKALRAADAILKTLTIGAKGARHHNSALLAVASGWPVICISVDGPATLMHKDKACLLFPSTTAASAREQKK